MDLVCHWESTAPPSGPPSSPCVLCIARQDYAHATKLLSAVVDLGHCQKGRQAVVQVKPKGSKFKAGKATAGVVFLEKGHWAHPHHKGSGKCCHLSQRGSGAESHKPKVFFFLALYSSFPSVHQHRNNDISLKIKTRLYQSTILSTLLYSAELWPLTAVLRKRLDTAHYRWQRNIHIRRLLERQANKWGYQR